MSSRHRLLRQQPDGSRRWSAPSAADVLVVPAGVSALRAAGPVSESEATLGPLALLEARQDGTLVLALGTGAALPGSLRLNGRPAPLLAPLHLGDRLDLPGGLCLFVSALRDQGPVAPPEALIGTECAVCRLPFEVKTRVHICPGCGEAVHAEGAEVDSGRRLTCVSLSPACTRCGRAHISGEGLAHVPGN